ncbi:acyl-CoA thioesterase [Halorussus salinus]|uniref:acyl-CoA thioesterase n=1 Tax=Halorussus salinus TaxID=1364935 RepID=UPI0010931325|nr:acyl-CoA thioesterase [Halorussus salinus]
MPTLSETHIRNRYRVQPNDANNYETLHGGELMKWMDELGAMSAMRFAGETCVTAGVEDISFHRPVPVGDIALVEAYVYDAGTTSVTVRIRAQREDPRTGDTERTTGSSFTFVALGEEGTPVPVPELTVETDEERDLREAAREAET